MSDRDGILDIHGKCRREREELEARLAEAERLIDEAKALAFAELEADIRRRGTRTDAEQDVIWAAYVWRKALPPGFEARSTVPERKLAAAVDALAAAEQSGPRRAVSGQTSGEDETEGGAGEWGPQCTCAIRPQLCPIHGYRADSGAGQAGEEVAG